MNNTSFKARITGLDNFYTEMKFQDKTFKDTKHRVVYNGKDPSTQWEHFSLLKNGETTVKEYPIFNIKSSDGDFSLEQLLKIFNILKIKEAQNFIAQQRKIKAEKEFIKLLEEFDKEEKLEVKA